MRRLLNGRDCHQCRCRTEEGKGNTPLRHIVSVVEILLLSIKAKRKEDVTY